ncbi:exodeoxyribonuclease III [Rhodococcus antarcticus]|uniref:Exodeoxyribonuclease III n=1 Tax=Rhodococcus antarcticus TaxID=2987751 RepID=A0ABY6NZG6_9NOCA|nr:exodeoxyribonuclease III [Rhodococcus antarcticus]UZJ24807.1 exodeoxyribonuclease III [Rhodococcus antarcticus]
MRLATWNVNSVTARLPRLLDWLATAQPDVLCLQETKTSVVAFPTAEVAALGYESAVAGQGRWNGVAVLSRIGLADIATTFAGAPSWDADTAADTLFTDGAGIVEARAVGATCGPLRVWSLYVPNGREPTHPHYAYKLAWLEAYRAAIADEVTAGPFVAVGDYNVAPTDADVWDVAAFAGSTHVTPAERDALAALRELGLSDVPARALKNDVPYTYWDYRGGAFHKNLGMRIDLVYASAPAAAAVTDAYVDRDARKGTGPSDHAPVVVDLDL